MNDYLKEKKVFVTGATGFIGASLTKRLLQEGCHVTALVRPSSDLWRLEDVLDQINIFNADLKDLPIDGLKIVMEDVHIVYHLGAAGVDQSQSDSSAIDETNVRGTASLLHAARDMQVGRFVYCGSCFEYGSGNFLREDAPLIPGNEYATSKVSAGILVNEAFHKYKQPVVYLRPFTVYGPFEGAPRLIPYVISCILGGRDIDLTEGKQTRDMVFIDDVVEAFVMAGIKSEAIGGIFNLATGRETTVKDIVITIMELMEATVKPLFSRKSYRESEWWKLSGDPSYCRDVLGWQAQTPFRDGLQKTIQWFRENKTKYPVYT